MKYLVSRKKLEANLSQNHITGFVFRQVRFTESLAASHVHEMFCLRNTGSLVLGRSHPAVESLEKQTKLISWGKQAAGPRHFHYIITTTCTVAEDL